MYIYPLKIKNIVLYCIVLYCTLHSCAGFLLDGDRTSTIIFSNCPNDFFYKTDG